MKYSILILLILSVSCDNSSEITSLGDDEPFSFGFSACYTNPNNRMLDEVWISSGRKLLEQNENFEIIISEFNQTSVNFTSTQTNRDSTWQSTSVAFSNKVCTDRPILINNNFVAVSYYQDPLFENFETIGRDESESSFISFGENNETIEWNSAVLPTNLRFSVNDSSFFEGGKILWDNKLNNARIIVDFGYFDTENLQFRNLETLRLDTLISKKEIFFNSNYFDNIEIDSLLSENNYLEIRVAFTTDKTEIQEYEYGRVAIISGSRVYARLFIDS